MAGEIFAGFSAFKTMLDMAKALKDLDTATARNSAVIELQEKILAAQTEYAALTERVSYLEEEVARFENWEAEKQRYQLEELPPGIFVYALKKGMERGEPPHKICANCYQKGLKSLLHNLGQNNGLTHWKCHGCGFDERTGRFIAPKIDRGPRRGIV